MREEVNKYYDTPEEPDAMADKMCECTGAFTDVK